METWHCSTCGYVYRPSEGDQAAGVRPGREFEELPPTWVCPVCASEQDAFEPLAAVQGGR
ncbi:MAG: rubredoxin [Deltaproteobacteria bacterium]|nr:rubredoxin [Deltaproteobacteria bacterium]